MPVARLPALDELIYLEPLDREILLARMKAAQLRRKKQNIKASLSLPDPAEWTDAFFWNPHTVVGDNDYSRARKLVLEDHQRRIFRKVFTINPETGRFPYRTVVYSAPKKSGKSTIGAAATCYFAQNVEAPNAVYILANDREQSAGRVFKFATPTLKALGGRKTGKYKYMLPNGTEVQASTSDPEKEAGGSYGLTVWDELWAYKSDRARLLWDELMPVATRNNSMRLVVTYAGFEDSSDLLLELFLRIFKDTTERELAEGAQPVPGLEDIVTTDGDGNSIPCCYEVPSIGLFYFNDHEQRMQWQKASGGVDLKAETESLLTETNALRLMHNRWQLTESRLLDSQVLLQSFARSHDIQTRKMTFGVDAGWKHDSSGVVGVYEDSGKYVTAYAKEYQPKPNEPLDLEETIMQEVLNLWRAGLINTRLPLVGEKKLVEKERLTPIDVWYDPTQMHQVAMNLRKKYKLLMAEFQQGRERLYADSFLVQQYNVGSIDNLESNELKSHLDAAKAQHQTDANRELIRIVKGSGEHAKPIDLAVAQSMAIYKCSKRPKVAVTGIAQGKATGGWARSR